MSTGQATPPQQIEHAGAARAVAMACPPSTLSELAKMPVEGWPPAGENARDYACRVLEDRTRREDPLQVQRWWAASGRRVMYALQAVTGCDEGSASFFVGCAANARYFARQDLGEDAVLRLAERAACWDAGAGWANRLT